MRRRRRGGLHAGPSLSDLDGSGRPVAPSEKPCTPDADHPSSRCGRQSRASSTSLSDASWRAGLNLSDLDGSECPVAPSRKPCNPDADHPSARRRQPGRPQRRRLGSRAKSPDKSRNPDADHPSARRRQSRATASGRRGSPVGPRACSSRRQRGVLEASYLSPPLRSPVGIAYPRRRSARGRGCAIRAQERPRPAVPTVACTLGSCQPGGAGLFECDVSLSPSYSGAP